ATLWMPATPAAARAALSPPVWENRRYVLGLVAVVALGGLVGLVTRASGGTEPAPPAPVALEQQGAP
ncbi:MAG TPA: hypothetical protein VK458_32080, partial [Myxococcaceae bacterium]|nr:hypothetical protein [Myxococcaceae bacterium]